MSGKNRAARRRAERKHGGPPPDYWNDYRRELQIGIAVLVVALLGTGFLIVRARQATQSELDAYCEVYDQTHEDVKAVTSPTTSTTVAPGTTVAPDGTVVPAVADTPPGSTPGTTAGTIPEAAGTTTTAIDPNERLKAAVAKRQSVGPQKVRDAWGLLGKALGGTKLTPTEQSNIQTARATVNDYAKNECHRDPPDL
jgi:hypothetical protein